MYIFYTYTREMNPVCMRHPLSWRPVHLDRSYLSMWKSSHSEIHVPQNVSSSQYQPPKSSSVVFIQVFCRLCLYGLTEISTSCLNITFIFPTLDQFTYVFLSQSLMRLKVRVRNILFKKLSSLNIMCLISCCVTWYVH